MAINIINLIKILPIDKCQFIQENRNDKGILGSTTYRVFPINKPFQLFEEMEFTLRPSGHIIMYKIYCRKFNRSDFYKLKHFVNLLYAYYGLDSYNRGKGTFDEDDKSEINKHFYDNYYGWVGRFYNFFDEIKKNKTDVRKRVQNPEGMISLELRDGDLYLQIVVEEERVRMNENCIPKNLLGIY